MAGTEKADAIVVGAGLAGLAAAAELADAGKSVILCDQEGEQSLGGQAFWSFGGLFFVNSPEQRRMGITDSHELALSDWMGTAGFDRAEDHWPRKWAEAYVAFAAGEKRSWLTAMGLKLFPVVGWAERGGGAAFGHGNSVPRFHVTWGTGTGVVAVFERRVREAVRRGRITFKFRHRVTELVREGGAVVGVRGVTLEDTKEERGKQTSRVQTGDFSFAAQAVVLAAGGIGGNHELVRQNWPTRLGKPPAFMVAGVPAYVDGSGIPLAEGAGANLINRDRMWHYVEGLRNWAPIWPNHGIRILPGPSSLWLDGAGKRLPAPYLPGYDTLGTLEYLRKTGFDHSWFVLTQAIIKKEFALSGSEQNPDLTSGSWLKTAGRAFNKGAPGPVEAFKQHGADFVVRGTLDELVRGMNALVGPEAQLDVATVKREIDARDLQLDNPFTKDVQLMGVYNSRRYRGDKLIRTATPHKLLDASKGPLIAVKLNVLTRKTLGGLETDLDARVLRAGGSPIPGLYAAGEVAGFGGGGMHGYRALEGTFLGGCIFSGRTAGRAAAQAVS